MTYNKLEDLDGLPQENIDRAAEMAKKNGQDGKWMFNVIWVGSNVIRPNDVVIVFRDTLVEPLARHVVHLVAYQGLVRPGHRAVDRRNAGERVGLHDGGGVCGGVDCVLQADLLLHGLPYRKDAGARDVHQHEKRKRDDKRDAVLAANQVHGLFSQDCDHAPPPPE